MGKFVVGTEFAQNLVKSVRPIKYDDTGLMSKIWIDEEGQINSFYKSVLLRMPATGFEAMQVDAESFRKAVNSARTKEITFNVTPAGNLSVTAGKLKTRMQTLNDPIPEQDKITSWYQTHGELLPTLLGLAKWVPDAAPRAWCTTLLLRNGYAYASNGSYMIREKLAVDFEFECALTKPMLDVLVKLKAEPTSIGYTKGKLFFGFAEGLEMNAPVLAEQWPDISSFFEMEYDMHEMSTELLEVLDQLKVYDEGKAILEVYDNVKARCHIPDRLLPKQTVEVVFTDTTFAIPFNISISEVTKLSKGMLEYGINSRTFCMSNDTKKIVLALKRD